MAEIPRRQPSVKALLRHITYADTPPASQAAFFLVWFGISGIFWAGKRTSYRNFLEHSRL